MTASERIVILTGAGISAESGLGTFRDVGGLWSQYDLADVATPEGFARDPGLVHAFYNARRQNCREAEPNAAHHALARLQAKHPDVVIVTQNVDDLHERGGAQAVIHMHGELMGALCAQCGARWSAPDRMEATDACPKCGSPATRPDIVWFGEIPYQMRRIEDALATATLFVAIGTSGEVYPAAGFVQDARAREAQTLELNLEPSGGANQFHSGRYGPATEIVPAWVAEILGD
ncbi:NAD-dependent deacylase [Actibacterium sp. 188UL27-1]|uniref:NAD-dependent deacylase n=1 Tax=Actibacterium sp. 188UL27-1 TaxID=2786961 RepID=UPI00195B3FB3|nr:NAD-dependent deacylase [Actibacterium sp. 188UL27-1]MBM7066151.1 NAD-dependent deacylase [Actibacterium sp. 188UL27-1]